MPIAQQQLIEVLADGCFHSGDELGKRWAVSRAAISKAIAKLVHLGLEVHSVRGKGYRLNDKLVLLSQEQILGALEQSSRHAIAQFSIFPVIDSTNNFLLEQITPTFQLPQGSYHVCLSEMQTAGRGRRGRQWVSPYGHNLYLSLLTTFHAGTKATEGLSLVVSVALVRTLATFGIQAAVKWPNDVLVGLYKLAGILIEMRGDPLGTCHLVIGIGVNIKLSKEQLQSIEQPTVTLVELGFSLERRNVLVADLIQTLFVVIEEFSAVGFTRFREEWEMADITRNRAVVVRARDAVHGIGGGVDETGALVLNTAAGIKHINSGDVSLRLCDQELGAGSL
jgi:BirA family transcriptional regulator, biotin operon repressor / biotin---[acetyl-CoA-carboxylase] ligase